MQNAPTQASEAQEATLTAAAQTFTERWQGVTASELSTAQSFVRELCELLGLACPHATPEQDYMFERPVTFSHGDGSTTPGRVDCYRRGRFVLEAKKLRAAGHTRGFDDALLRARAQAEGYARALPALEGLPPFLLVVDVGNVIELYSEFSRSGATYTPFPNPGSWPAWRVRSNGAATSPTTLPPSSRGRLARHAARPGPRRGSDSGRHPHRPAANRYRSLLQGARPVEKEPAAHPRHARSAGPGAARRVGLARVMACASTASTRFNTRKQA